jgi:hypothetical protein
MDSIDTLPPAPHGPDDDLPPEPRKLTPELIEAFRRLLAEKGHFRIVACRKLHIGWSTFRRWLDLGAKYPEGIYGHLLATVLAAEADAENAMLDLVLGEARLDAKHAEWYLERKFPQRWGRGRGDFARLMRELNEVKKLLLERERDGLPDPEIVE